MKRLILLSLTLISFNSFSIIPDGGLCSATLEDFSEIAKEYGPKTSKDSTLNFIKFLSVINKASRICELKEIHEKTTDESIKPLLKEKISRQAREFKSLVASEKQKIRKLKPKFQPSSFKWLERYLDLVSQSIVKIDTNNLDKLNQG